MVARADGPFGVYIGDDSTITIVRSATTAPAEFAPRPEKTVWTKRTKGRRLQPRRIYRKERLRPEVREPRGSRAW